MGRSQTEIIDTLPTGGGRAIGRPKGALGKDTRGRRAAIGVLDQLFADEANLEILRGAMEEAFARDPVRFFERFGLPFATKALQIQVSDTPNGGKQLRMVMSGADGAVETDLSVISEQPSPEVVVPVQARGVNSSEAKQRRLKSIKHQIKALEEVGENEPLVKQRLAYIMDGKAG